MDILRYIKSYINTLIIPLELSTNVAVMTWPVLSHCTNVWCLLLAFFSLFLSLPFLGSRWTPGNRDVILGGPYKWQDDEQKQYCTGLRHLQKTRNPIVFLCSKYFDFDCESSLCIRLYLYTKTVLERNSLHK